MSQRSNNQGIRYGVVFNCTNPKPWFKPWDQHYQQVLDQAVAAEALGYDHVWLTEHHFLEHGYCPSLLTVAAAFAARTSRIKIGTWVLLLPLHNALRVAEDAAVVDLISKGRFILGVGLGYRVEEFQALGIPREERPTRMEEGIEVLRLAWSQDRFSYAGKHYQFDNLTVTPKPAQPGGPPIWMAVRGKRPARRAARLGCPIALAAGGGREELELWRNDLRSRGQDPDRFEVLVPRNVYVTDDPQATADELGPYLTWDREGPTDLVVHYREAADHPRDARLFRRPSDMAAPRSLQIVGDPDRCVGELERQQRDLPATDVVLTFANGLPHQRTLHYMERFAREVMPRARNPRA
ncbi:MAG: LLM class flavin-dependent oxidoreductase [Dehalococcoidia bacterium]